MLINEKRCSLQVLIEDKDEQDMLKKEAQLNEVLMKHGIQFSCAPSRNQGRKGLTRYTLSIIFDKETIGRGAGRKPVKCLIPMEEALRMEETGEEKKQIAKKMGVSLPTYYRKRKEFLTNKK
jgi:hypothetical protein